jgi:hypothetical protein
MIVIPTVIIQDTMPTVFINESASAVIVVSINAPAGPAGLSLISLTTSTNLSGILAGDGTNIITATAGTDYVAPTDPRLSDARTPTSHSHAATDVTEDSTHRFATDTEKSTWNGKQDALGFTPVNTTDARLTDARTPTDHNQAINTITGLQTALDGKLDVFFNNNIGTPGMAGFGVGIAPPAAIPTGMVAMAGCNDRLSPNYGNYQYQDGSIMVWVPKFYYKIGTQYSTAITAITQANPAVVTAAAHGLSNGATVVINNVVGMTQVNDLTFTVANVTTNTFELQGVNSTGYTAYSSAGAVTWGNGINRNVVMIKASSAYANTAAANADGYALHRAFIDGDVEQSGFFVDKYMASKNACGSGYIGSSIKGGKPLSTASAHNPLAGCTAGANYYYAALDVAKARDGVNGAKNANSIFFCTSRFIYGALALISMAHGQASGGTANCAWWSSGTTNFPKGCNNNALADSDDTTVKFISDGYQNCALTGSGVPFAKTTHNGQECGIADLNGLMYEVSPGMTCIATTKSITGITQANPAVVTSNNHGLTNGTQILITGVVGMTQVNDIIHTVANATTNTFELSGINSSGYTAYSSAGTITTGTFYVLKQSVSMKSITSGNTGATDHWGATGVAANFDAISLPMVNGAVTQKFGNSSQQVLAGDTSGDPWKLTGLGLPRASTSISASGASLFGVDYYYQYIINEMVPLSCFHWNSGSAAGVWAVYFSYARSNSLLYVGFRAACYPVG